MKKKTILGLTILLALVLLLLYLVIPIINNSKQPDLDTLKKLSDAEIEKMNASLTEQHYGYLTFDREKNEFVHLGIYSMRFYGSFSGCMVLFTPYNERSHTSLSVAGIDFTSDNSFTIFAYKNDVFLKLEDAYKIGWLNKSQIKKIAKIHNEFED